jgi:hypothetical protein
MEHVPSVSGMMFRERCSGNDVPGTMGQILTCAIFLFVIFIKFLSVRCVNSLHPPVSYTAYPILFTSYPSTHPAVTAFFSTGHRGHLWRLLPCSCLAPLCYNATRHEAKAIARPCSPASLPLHPTAARPRAKPRTDDI